MLQEDLGFIRMAASTGGMAGDATGAVEVDASSLGAIVAMSAIAGIIIGSTWIRRRTVNTYVGESRSFAERGGPRRVVSYDPEARPRRDPIDEDAPRRRVVYEGSLAPTPSRRRESEEELDIVGAIAGLTEKKGYLAPWVIERDGELQVIAVDPMAKFTRREVPVTRSPSAFYKGTETEEMMVPEYGAGKMVTFKVPILPGNRLGAPTQISEATSIDRRIYRENMPPEVFGQKDKEGRYRYPWESPAYSSQDYQQIMAQARAHVRRMQRALKGNK